MNKVVKSLGLVSFVLQFGFVEPVLISPVQIPPAERWMGYSQKDLKDKYKRISNDLTKAVLDEMMGQFEQCIKKAQKVNSKSIVFDRALALEVRCTSKGLENGSISPAEVLKNAARIEKLSVQLKQKEKDLALQNRLKSMTELAKKSQWKTFKQELQGALQLEGQMTKSQRAQLYADIGDLMISDRKWSDALTAFTRAKDYDQDVAVDSRIKNILPLISKAQREAFESAKAAKTQGPEVVPIQMASEEADLFNQCQAELSKGDVASAAEALIGLMKKFPVGLKSKWAQDKVSELLAKEVEKSRGPQGSSVNKSKIIKEILRLDGERQNDWAKMLFDMQDYSGAAQIYERISENYESSPRVSKALYMAARGYQLSQEFGKAKDLYRKLTKFYSMSPEFIDACIQWALIDYNENELSEAITHLEMARSRKMTGQQDLISLFWLFKTYKLKNEEALRVKVAQDLVTRFPLTYYSLIAGFEVNKKLPHFEKSEEKFLKLKLSDFEKKTVARAQALIAVGLFEDASDELSILTQRDLSVEEQYVISLLFTRALNYPKAFSFLTEIFDHHPELQDDRTMKTLFPKEFWAHVSDDQKRSQLDPYLLLSVMRQESAFRPQAVSRSNAIGLLQMIPPTAEEVKAQLGSKIEIPKDLFDPANNVKFCAFYLAQLIQKFNGDIPAALAAYNAGPTRIGLFVKAQGGTLRDTWVDELPLSETSFYVKAILKNYIFYRIIYEGKTQLNNPPWAMKEG